jgi:hypothetical protein
MALVQRAGQFVESTQNRRYGYRFLCIHIKGDVKYLQFVTVCRYKVLPMDLNFLGEGLALRFLISVYVVEG